MLNWWRRNGKKPGASDRSIPGQSRLRVRAVSSQRANVLQKRMRCIEKSIDYNGEIKVSREK